MRFPCSTPHSAFDLPAALGQFGSMIRFAIALSVLTLTACASPPPESPQTAQAKSDAAQVYQDLQVRSVQQQMMTYNNVLTYGNAAVNCGLRTPQWYTLLQQVYGQQYALELQRVPLNASQQAQAASYAAAHVQNPSPPPYICGRIKQDTLLPVLDSAVAMRSFEVAYAKARS
jgi:hypothetical protein